MVTSFFMGWIGLNYAVLAWMCYRACRLDGLGPRRAALAAAAAPVTLLRGPTAASGVRG